MIDPTLSSTNLLPPREINEVSVVKDSSENSQQPKNVDMLLQAIPVFTKSLPLMEAIPSLEPSSCEGLNEEAVEGKYEYEFSLLVDGCLCFVHLYDTNDIS